VGNISQSGNIEFCRHPHLDLSVSSEVKEMIIWLQESWILPQRPALNPTNTEIGCGKDHSINYGKFQRVP
jgi:hypothetical protein